MRKIAEIDKQLQKEHNAVTQLYSQINTYKNSIDNLKKERKVAEKGLRTVLGRK